ncbi:hypothetical protein [Cerasicoccus arenae]|uniref:Uncharacterized protein n=1 Tax=Cerasicoccus arenae TaxID=424488 RepID=A0A8J3DC38_9BACT|nr:hypothetical protein [Cerasicoccus arenae]MBK1859563.1 hypothetical protein [Cerasicoccus arenae]GHC03093.1 hypothetical protein GCM10007047_19550 [Cerasicoccus arenae]
MKSVRLFLLVSLLAARVFALDPNDVVSFDRYDIDPSELFFEEDTRIVPDRTYVLLRNFRPMSTPSGDRYAMITLENQLSSRQILDPEEFVGIFADGTRRYPKDFSVRMEPGRTRTIVVKFGTHSFPLVKIIIDNGAN